MSCSVFREQRPVHNGLIEGGFPPLGLSRARLCSTAGASSLLTSHVATRVVSLGPQTRLFLFLPLIVIKTRLSRGN